MQTNLMNLEFVDFDTFPNKEYIASGIFLLRFLGIRYHSHPTPLPVQHCFATIEAKKLLVCYVLTEAVRL